MTTFNLIHPVHQLFFYFFIITAFFCALIIIKKMRTKKQPKLLEKAKFNSTMKGKMVEINNVDTSVFNIWPYVSRLKAAKILSHKIKERELVYKVYRDSTQKFEHILLATEKENNFVALVVDRNKKKLMGYSLLDSNGEYSLN